MFLFSCLVESKGGVRHFFNAICLFMSIGMVAGVPCWSPLLLLRPSSREMGFAHLPITFSRFSPESYPPCPLPNWPPIAHNMPVSAMTLVRIEAGPSGWHNLIIRFFVVAANSLNFKSSLFAHYHLYAGVFARHLGNCSSLA